MSTEIKCTSPTWCDESSSCWGCWYAVPVVTKRVLLVGRARGGKGGEIKIEQVNYDLFFETGIFRKVENPPCGLECLDPSWNKSTCPRYGDCPYDNS